MRRGFRFVSSSALCWLFCGWASPALAADPASTDAAVEESAGTGRTDAPRFGVSLGTGLIAGIGSVSSITGDAVSDEGRPILMQILVLPSYRIAPHFALGLRAGFAFEPGTRGEASPSGDVDLSRQLWQFAASATYQPGAGRGFYVSVDAGIASLVEHAGDASGTISAALIGGGVGYDFRLANIFALGLDVRGSWTAFDGDLPLGVSGAPRYYDYDLDGWVGASVTGTLLL